MGDQGPPIRPVILQEVRVGFGRSPVQGWFFAVGVVGSPQGRHGVHQTGRPAFDQHSANGMPNQYQGPLPGSGPGYHERVDEIFGVAEESCCAGVRQRHPEQTAAKICAQEPSAIPGQRRVIERNLRSSAERDVAEPDIAIIGIHSRLAGQSPIDKPELSTRSLLVGVAFLPRAAKINA